MHEKQFEELKLTGNLPSPTGVGLQILKVTQHPDASLDDVLGVLQADPTLTGRLLKLANSGNTTGYHRAGTAREAAVRLGLRTVRNVSLGFSLLAGNRTGRCEGFDYEGYWSHSLAVGVAAQEVATLRSNVDPSEAFTCGLLSGIGRLALASIHPEEYALVLERARDLSSRELAEIELESFGTHHRELAAAMLADWRLPETFVEAVKLVGCGAPVTDIRLAAARPLACTLQDARDLARALGLAVDASPATCRERSAEIDRMRERLGLDEAGLDALWERCRTGWRTWGDLMRVRAQALLGLVDIRTRAACPDAAPLAPAARQPGAEAASAPEALAGTTSRLRVLLVGREALPDSTLSSELAADGHEVHTAEDGQQGLARALEISPHVVVTDWVMPEVEGPELVRTLRESEVGMRMHFVLLTDRGEAERVLEAFECGVDESIQRPFDARILRARVRAAQRVVGLTERVEALLREREHQVGQLSVLYRKLHLLAVTDPLTGLKNRRYALDRLEKEIAAARGDQRALSIVMVDVDHFKAVNDQYGHDTGDEVLRRVARTLHASVRRIDSACRIGGEEFLVICPGADAHAGRRVAERLRKAAEETVIEYARFRRPVTISLGVATLAAGHADVDSLVKLADERTYQAKQAGRNCVVGEGDEPPARLAG